MVHAIPMVKASLNHLQALPHHSPTDSHPAECMSSCLPAQAAAALAAAHTMRLQCPKAHQDNTPLLSASMTCRPLPVARKRQLHAQLPLDEVIAHPLLLQPSPVPVHHHAWTPGCA